MNSVKSTCDYFGSMSDNVKEDLLLYADSLFDENKNKVLKATINYIKNTERFSGSLFWLMYNFLLFTYNSDHLVITLFRVDYC